MQWFLGHTNIDQDVFKKVIFNSVEPNKEACGNYSYRSEVYKKKPPITFTNCLWDSNQSQSVALPEQHDYLQELDDIVLGGN